MGTPVSRRIRRFASQDGTFRRSSLSCRCCRQPHTRSYPSSSLETSAGMSRGSFWRSPSSDTITWPRALSNPAIIAAVCPTFAPSRRPWTRGSACRRADLIPGAIPAAIVDQNDLERVRIGLQRLQNPLHQWAHVLRLVDRAERPPRASGRSPGVATGGGGHSRILVTRSGITTRIGPSRCLYQQSSFRREAQLGSH